jgi:hypothetical protein
MALDAPNKMLILRSGAGNLWMVGGGGHGKVTGGKEETKSPKKQQASKEGRAGAIRRVKMPNK